MVTAIAADEAMLFYGPHSADVALLAEHLSGKSLQAVRSFIERAPATAWERAQITGLLKQLLAEQGIKHLLPGGILVACSCSAHVAAEEFFNAVRQSAAKSGRNQ